MKKRVDLRRRVAAGMYYSDIQGDKLFCRYA